VTHYLHPDELNLPAVPPPPRRRCANPACRVWLARDNLGDLCAPCLEIDNQQTEELRWQRTDWS